ncbi:hypothetical protein OIU34_22845 [Pararhizobium sp. BT-229]|uniref:hypothetical protein n=1 Tax=Pararhizobium sp. BT-229 TaxID=2986923 RepID=UPI0021F6BFEE|nr:hypothetical protein [Pararhizobium sp. BT-229]MCV9964733.1 hypothetical protein [Pararhizobium sp. BT-229]
MTLRFELPIVYMNIGTPPKCRTRQDYKVHDKAWFEFPVADASELEPALTFRLRYRLEEGGELKTSDTVFHQYRGHLMREPNASRRLLNDRKLDVEVLARLAGEGIHSLPEIFKVPSSRFWYGHGTGYMAETLKEKHVGVSRRDEAITELQALISDNLVIVDGIVYEKIHDPKINVSVSSKDYSVDPSLIASGNYSFPFDRMDLVDEFTSWLESEHGIARKREDDNWARDRRFIVDAPEVPLSANPVIEAALKLADMAQLNIINVDYWGPETKRLGLALRENPTVENAFAFADTFEAAAMLPGAHKVGYGMEDPALLFSSFRKFVELMPDEYKPGFTDTIDIPLSFSAMHPSARP